MRLLRSIGHIYERTKLARAVRAAPRIRLILGAAKTAQPGWISTNRDTLDIAREQDWRRLLGGRLADALMAEHVWEHLDDDVTARANVLCHRFLKPGGHLRLAVPDGLNPDPAYREHVRPGGSGPGADDHQVLYDYRLMTERLGRTGFTVGLLEYWDEHGQFHFTDWSSEGGHIARSRRHDPRNQDGPLRYTSLIVDAVKD